MRTTTLKITPEVTWRLCCVCSLVMFCLCYLMQSVRAAEWDNEAYWETSDVKFNFMSTSMTFKNDKKIVFLTPFSLFQQEQVVPELTAYEEFHYNPNAALTDFNGKYSALKQRASTMQFTLKGYTLIKMQDNNTSYWTLERIREREIRKPLFSISLIKHFD